MECASSTWCLLQPMMSTLSALPAEQSCSLYGHGSVAAAVTRDGDNTYVDSQVDVAVVP